MAIGKGNFNGLSFRIFTDKISNRLPKPERKFAADMAYGMLASGSCLLTDIADQLHEPSKKINVVDRLSRYLEKGTPAEAAASYHFQAMEQGAALFGKATFAMNRGYDDNKIFLKLR